jgi:hypothetical protein
LSEDLGIFLLKAVAFVAPVPRPEDVGNDALATLIRWDGPRRLIPDLSCFVQLKSRSHTSVTYSTPDEMAWLTGLEMPLFIGRVDLQEGRIELFTTVRLHQILLETQYERVELLLDEAPETSKSTGVRLANLGPPVLSWSVADVNEPDFLEKAHGVLRPHVEWLRTNRALREIQTHICIQWETGQPPTEAGISRHYSPKNDIRDTLKGMTPHVQRMMSELQFRQKYGDFWLILAFFDLMRRWGHDPDPGRVVTMVAASSARASCCARTSGAAVGSGWTL